MGSLALWLNVSSMNQEPATTGLARFCADQKIDFVAYRYDEGKEAQFHYEGEVDHNIQRKVRELNPEIIIYSGPAAGKCKPSLDTLLSLRMGARTIGYVLDGGCPEWHPLLEEYRKKNVFSLMVNTDGNPVWPKREQDITTWQPVDEAFYAHGVRKDIKLGFAGGAGSKHRQEAIQALTEQCGLVVAERREDWGSYAHFADFMSRCRITVNFPETGSGKSCHLKNRVMEAGYARCCLFEKKNSITPLYFRPNVDYVQYEDLEDLIFKLKAISDAEVDSYACNLSVRCRELYTADRLWTKIFAALANISNP